MVIMPRFASYDGTTLAYQIVGHGPPLVCLAGGPGADVRDLDGLASLAGLDAERSLVLLDSRAGGGSEVPTDRASCAFTAQARDVEALRRHLGLERIDLLGHSAGTLTAQEYAASEPRRIGRLVLVTPAGRLSREPDEAELATIRAEHAGRIWRGHGAWSPAAQQHEEDSAGYVTPPAWLREAFYAGAATGEEAPARVARLAAVRCPVLVLAGECDPIAGTAPARLVATCYPAGSLVVLPGCGHWPWVDAPSAFRAALSQFLA
jgi:pimeloyl-ACP methyl ester carboxylesterase